MAEVEEYYRRIERWRNGSAVLVLFQLKSNQKSCWHHSVFLPQLHSVMLHVLCFLVSIHSTAMH